MAVGTKEDNVGGGRCPSDYIDNSVELSGVGQYRIICVIRCTYGWIIHPILVTYHLTLSHMKLVFPFTEFNKSGLIFCRLSKRVRI